MLRLGMKRFRMSLGRLAVQSGVGSWRYGRRLVNSAEARISLSNLAMFDLAGITQTVVCSNHASIGGG